MSCACSGNRSYSALVYQGRHDGFFGKWECFAWNVLDFFILTSRTRKIKLLSFRKDHMDVVVRARAARSAKETATEDVHAKARIYCVETIVKTKTYLLRYSRDNKCAAKSLSL